MMNVQEPSPTNIAPNNVRGASLGSTYGCFGFIFAFILGVIVLSLLGSLITAIAGHAVSLTGPGAVLLSLLNILIPIVALVIVYYAWLRKTNPVFRAGFLWTYGILLALYIFSVCAFIVFSIVLNGTSVLGR